ncbi:MAG: HAMP domain-containing histidine kinase [Bacilli bacterium]|nr:HAMP domain-containing histidine kinase [Bacilli bacterium]
MKKFSYTLFGFFGFLIVATFNISLGIVIYSFVEEKSDLFVGLLIFGLIVLSAALCSLIDYVRRKIMIERPLNEILYATKQMTKGNFKINLVPNHSYKYYDEYDYIKEDLNNMALELSKSEVLKNDFIANVSHEIKTPLSAIQNYVKILSNNDLDEETRSKYLVNLQKSCQKLNQLVMNILKLNKLENQNLNFQTTNFNLSELLTSQVLRYVELIEEKNIELICDIDEDIYINSEENHLEVIFNNLISNAIKFTSEGSIYISLKKNKEDYIITFKDTGCGMNEETGKHIFDKFYQGDTSHYKEGNGLGLALVKKVIDILGGSISVESELGVGTTFVVTIKEI